MRSTGRLIAALVAILALSAMAIGGVVRAQTPNSSPTPTPSGQTGQPAQTGQNNQRKAQAQTLMNDFLNQLAQNLHIDRATLDAALKTTANQEVDKAVANGSLTQAQADQIKQHIASGQFPLGVGFHLGEKENGAEACKTGSAFASALGISESDLRQALHNGQTPAQIAQAHGKSLQDVQNAIAASVKPCLDQQVQAGKITQQQEDQILQRIQQGQGLEGGHHGRRGMKSSATPSSPQQ